MCQCRQPTENPHLGGPVEPEVEETLRFLEEITPVAEMWGTPSPWYQRSDWEDSAKLQYDATDYDWAFYATVQRTSYVGEFMGNVITSSLYQKLTPVEDAEWTCITEA